MTLNERESRTLEQLRRLLEADDPRLARRLRTMSWGPTTSVLAVYVLATTLAGLLLVGLGRTVDQPALTTLGVLFALCAPIGATMWFGRPYLAA